MDATVLPQYQIVKCIESEIAHCINLFFMCTRILLL